MNTKHSSVDGIGDGIFEASMSQTCSHAGFTVQLIIEWE